MALALDLGRLKGLALFLGAAVSAVAGMGATLALSKNRLDDTYARVSALEAKTQTHDSALSRIDQSLQDVKETTGRIERLLLEGSRRGP